MRTSEVAAFDTEDDGAGNPRLYVVVHRRGVFSSQDRERFLDWLKEWSRKTWHEGKQPEVWATNLEYDLVNLFGLEGLENVRLRFGRSFLVGARWQRIEFRDTVRHIPASVAELGKLVGLEKLEASAFESRRPPSLQVLTRRCVRDATITYRTALFLHETYLDLGVIPRGTLASTAYRLWSESYFPEPVRAADPDVIEAARLAYHGGRTEPFLIGSRSPAFVLDVASMFPWAMTQGDFPVPWGAVRSARKGDPPNPRGIYWARIEVRHGVPPMPYRTPEGTIYPLGTWAAWITGEEACYLLSIGHKVRVIRGFEFARSCRPFDGYVRELFQRKNKSRGSERTMYKLLLNSLYGKFGQKSERIVVESLAKYEARKHPPIAHVFLGLALYRVEGKPVPWGNMVWPAIVTARARIRLHQELEKIRARGGTPLYVDTDSIIYNGSSLRYPVQATEPGQFELRGKFRSVEIVGKKEYALECRKNEWIEHAKGIPKAVRMEYLRTGRASFVRPSRLLESVRRELKPNVWSEREKVRRISYELRDRNPDGTLAPIVIEA